MGKISSALLWCLLEPWGKIHPGTAWPHLTLTPRKGPPCTSLGPEMTHFVPSCLGRVRSPFCYPERPLQRMKRQATVLHSFPLGQLTSTDGVPARPASCVVEEDFSADLCNPVQGQTTDTNPDGLQWSPTSFTAVLGRIRGRACSRSLMMATKLPSAFSCPSTIIFEGWAQTPPSPSRLPSPSH